MKQRQARILARPQTSQTPRRMGQVFVGAAVLATGLLVLPPCNEQTPQPRTAPTATRPKKQPVKCTEEMTTSWEWLSLSWHLKSKVLLHQHLLRPALGVNDHTPVSIYMSMTIDSSGKITPRQAYARCDYTTDCPKEIDIFKIARIDFDEMKPLPPPQERCLFDTSQNF